MKFKRLLVQVDSTFPSKLQILPKLTTTSPNPSNPKSLEEKKTSAQL